MVDSSSLTRLLTALTRATLLRVARTFGLSLPAGYVTKQELVRSLACAPHVGSREVIQTQLSKPELVRGCEKLGFQAGGTKNQLVRRLCRGLRWRPFEAAREHARSLELKRSRDWAAYSRGDYADTLGERPDDVPGAPDATYAGLGWTHWGDFLGTGAGPRGRVAFLPFEEARAFVRTLRLRNTADWRAWLKGELKDRPPRPPTIPATPDGVYRDRGWNGSGDWLGTETVATRERVYWPYARARRFVRRLGLRSQAGWREWLRGKRLDLPPMPVEIPRTPHVVYREWESWGTWLGTGYVAPRDRRRLSFAEARRLSRAQGFTLRVAWRAWRASPACPPGMRAHPPIAYQDEGWSGWEDFLGPSCRPAHTKFRSFAEARALVRSLGLTSRTQYGAWRRGGLPELPACPRDVPAHPQRVYVEAWQGWGDFLGTGRAKRGDRVYWSFEKGRDFARGLGLGSRSEWQRWAKGELVGLPELPSGIPYNPDRIYGDAWQGWADFLGGSKQGFLPYAEARVRARAQGLNSSNAWKAWWRGQDPPPHGLPCKPRRYYKDSWAGWADWLGESYSGRQRELAARCTEGS